MDQNIAQEYYQEQQQLNKKDRPWLRWLILAIVALVAMVVILSV